MRDCVRFEGFCGGYGCGGGLHAKWNASSCVCGGARLFRSPSLAQVVFKWKSSFVHEGEEGGGGWGCVRGKVNKTGECLYA